MMMLNQTMAHAMERLRGVFGLISFLLGFNISGRDENSGSSRPVNSTLTIVKRLARYLIVKLYKVWRNDIPVIVDSIPGIGHKSPNFASYAPHRANKKLRQVGITVRSDSTN